jgi:hypothetical protein
VGKLEKGGREDRPREDHRWEEGHRVDHLGIAMRRDLLIPLWTALVTVRISNMDRT